MAPTGGIASKNQYPGFSAYYKLTAGTPYSYSTAVLIEGCTIGRFAVGVMISPTGKSANAENIVIRHTEFEICRVAVAIAQDQARGLNLENCSGYLLNTFVDNRTYGAGTEGTPPNIRGLAVSQVKYLFNLEMGVSSVSFHQIYAEALLSLGFLGLSQRVDQYQVGFSGCEFAFHASHPMIDVHCYSRAGLQFSSCMFGMVGAVTRSHPPISFANFGPVIFENCRLQSGRVAPGGVALDITVAADADWLNGAHAWGFSDATLVEYKTVAHLDSYALADPLVIPGRAAYPSSVNTTADRRVSSGPGGHHDRARSGEAVPAARRHHRSYGRLCGVHGAPPHGERHNQQDFPPLGCRLSDAVLSGAAGRDLFRGACGAGLGR